VSQFVCLWLAEKKKGGGGEKIFIFVDQKGGFQFRAPRHGLVRGKKEGKGRRSRSYREEEGRRANSNNRLHSLVGGIKRRERKEGNETKRSILPATRRKGKRGKVGAAPLPEKKKEGVAVPYNVGSSTDRKGTILFYAVQKGKEKGPISFERSKEKNLLEEGGERLSSSLVSPEGEREKRKNVHSAYVWREGIEKKIGAFSPLTTAQKKKRERRKGYDPSASTLSCRTRSAH